MRLLSPFLCLLVYPFISQGQDVGSVLGRMDQAAPAFKAMTADLKMVTYTKILDDKTTETATVTMQRVKKNDTRARIEFSGESARTLTLQGKIVRIYYPNLNQYQDFDVGKTVNVNQFLLLGFGSSGKELSANYDIKGAGTEKIAGVETTKLLLTPKDKRAQEHLQTAEIWVPNDSPNPIQQRFIEPSGNYRLVTYSNIHLNPRLPQSIQWTVPAGAKEKR
ncbi:MAG: outer membrane lipoprotein carrier protein LolA [Acidobacteriaceae bacterium]|nr:outer membrane lipoprotein carrier protein LolA [Acidobacteriaceae bacterium]MBV9037020.1 outer membrane lipoprotein carrier protein LolA [Acidobacteriaceae bacterium]MBV9677824.1 outer membrane lipoprotein carrier protein LolA [Acidobacteriaceae bacterium]MBV9938946.1 outer membrane lipoprotein carrier protein LolA [Acidobacteriaceae bacterium]